MTEETVRCRVEGWPLTSPMSPVESLVLVQSAESALARLSWPDAGLSLPTAFFDPERDVIVIEAQIPPGSPCAVGVRRLVAVAMLMSLIRPRWLWTVRDDAGALLAELGVDDLVAWRGIYGRHPYPSPDWSALDVAKDQLFDHTIRWALSAVLGTELEVLGVRVPPQPDAPGTAPADGELPPLLLFDYQPADDWRTPGVEALVLLGRSMVQVDGRRGDGQHDVHGRIEVHNPSAMDLTGARVQIRLCSAAGTLLAVVEGELTALSAGGTRPVTATGTVRLGGHVVASVDIGCEAQLAREVRFQARVLVAAEGEA